MERVAEKSGFAPKRLARQLDFTELNGLTVALPFFEQLKSEPKPETESNSSPRPLLRGTIKSDFLSLQADNSTEVKDGTLEELQRCKCRQSRCVKLYCQCFATGTYCDGCSCINCQNNVDNKAVREVALASTLERNRKAFGTKIANSPNESHDYEDDTKNIMLFAKYKGCHCNKSRCLKRYCECFRAKIPCSENCKCTGCKNFEKCEERLALYNGRNAKSMAFIKQTNVAISGAIGFSGYRSSKKYMKRKYQENFPGSIRGYPLICTLTQDLQILSFHIG